MQQQRTEAAPTGPYELDPHQWVSRYADYLYSYAISRLNDEEQARDLVQESFLAALERIDRFEGRSTERTWLTAILKHKIIDFYRRKSSGLLKMMDNREAMQESSDFFDPVDGHWKTAYHPRLLGIEDQDPIGNKELARILQLCMKKLPTLWYAVFTMKHMEEEDTERICSDLRVTPSNFWVIIHRAKVNLRSCLQKNWI